ncbi:MAG: hypothetical protein Ct9H300mP25_11720 [Acidobacteriota bacterium]|nr:MAG: hypothetical protein Ct9H300mP25_11720 [Acidobacteriota bacterium]
MAGFVAFDFGGPVAVSQPVWRVVIAVAHPEFRDVSILEFNLMKVSCDDGV